MLAVVLCVVLFVCAVLDVEADDASWTRIICEGYSEARLVTIAMEITSNPVAFFCPDFFSTKLGISF